ncbi:MAG: hypothetical protein ACQKBY_05335 [Verrucomicrobiales bacterium]
MKIDPQDYFLLWLLLAGSLLVLDLLWSVLAASRERAERGRWQRQCPGCGVIYVGRRKGEKVRRKEPCPECLEKSAQDEACARGDQGIEVSKHPSRNL